jgi:hypothetical protein
MAAPALKRNLVAMSAQKLVQHVIGGRPATADDGVDITGWRTNLEFSAPYAVVFVECDAAATISALMGSIGIELLGYRTNFGWRLIGYLNNAGQITIAADLIGYAQECDVLGVFERLCIAATVSAGTAIAKFCPLEYYT